jgi:hypothetical protein
MMTPPKKECAGELEKKKINNSDIYSIYIYGENCKGGITTTFSSGKDDEEAYQERKRESPPGVPANSLS